MKLRKISPSNISWRFFPIEQIHEMYEANKQVIGFDLHTYTDNQVLNLNSYELNKSYEWHKVLLDFYLGFRYSIIKHFDFFLWLFSGCRLVVVLISFILVFDLLN